MVKILKFLLPEYWSSPEENRLRDKTTARWNGLIVICFGSAMLIFTTVTFVAKSFDPEVLARGLAISVPVLLGGIAVRRWGLKQ